MKIREDFVSNSSSSSFVLYGVSFDADELLNKLKNSPFASVRSAVENNGDSISDVLYEFFDYDELVYDYDGNTVVIGLPPRKMTDDETLRMFKQKVIDKIKLIGIEKAITDVELVTGVDSDGEICFD